MSFLECGLSSLFREGVFFSCRLVDITRDTRSVRGSRVRDGARGRGRDAPSRACLLLSSWEFVLIMHRLGVGHGVSEGLCVAWGGGRGMLLFVDSPPAPYSCHSGSPELSPLTSQLRNLCPSAHVPSTLPHPRPGKSPRGKAVAV